VTQVPCLTQIEVGAADHAGVPDGYTYGSIMRLARVATCGVALALLMGSMASASAFDNTWKQVATGTTGGVSGLAPAGIGWVISRDNKLAGQNRIALLGNDGQVTPLTWRGTPPQDLESLSAVPAVASQYVTLTSTGSGYVISLDATAVNVVRTFTVPRGSANIESFALTQTDSAVLAVWATRGSTTAPAALFAATFTPATGAFGRVVTAKVTVPYPTTAVRQISDLTVTSGRIIASSASDPGVNGPFASALYDIGAVSVVGGRAALALQPPVTLGTYPGHKVEGIACGGTGGLLGSDDEKRGGWVRMETFCR